MFEFVMLYHMTIIKYLLRRKCKLRRLFLSTKCLRTYTRYLESCILFRVHLLKYNVYVCNNVANVIQRALVEH